MNNNKRLKPNLLDPIVRKRIVKTLNPPVEDYWAPTKNTAQTFFQKYIKPNVGLFIVIIIFILFLFYRYRMIKKNRETSEIEKLYNQQNEHQNQHQNGHDNPADQAIVTVVHHNEPNKDNPPGKNQPDPKKETDDYTRLLMYLYEQQKDSMREPIHKNYSSRMKPAKTIGPKFAYPMYPYAKGGTLTPPSGK